MATEEREALDQRAGLERSLVQWQEPAAAEVSELLQEIAGGAMGSAQPIQLERLKAAVYRVRIDTAPGHTLVLKRHRPGVAQVDRLVVEQWLPALGLGECCPKLLAAVAERAGGWVWHVYEDLGDETLAAQRVPGRLAAAVDCIADLHTRAARHAILPEVRWRARDYGVHFFTANLRDAIAALEALATPPRQVPREFSGARERLLRRLHELREDAPRRVQLIEEASGLETLLHGDLWPKNVFVPTAARGPTTRLIDWDHVGVGPFSYDLSTFLYQSSAAERPGIVTRYREAVGRAGWRLPGDRELNLLCHTAESARYAHCIVWAALALSEGAEWGIAQIMDFECWFAALRPPLPE